MCYSCAAGRCYRDQQFTANSATRCNTSNEMIQFRRNRPAQLSCERFGGTERRVNIEAAGMIREMR
jgi:hypothetical protein